MAPAPRGARLLLLLFVHSSALLLASAAAAGRADCEELGFVSVSCADCASMGEFVKDEALLEECKGCCVADDSDARYTHARLEVCPYKLNGLPEIQDFIDKWSAPFRKQLKIAKQVGKVPKLVLTHKATGAHASVRIDQWKVATLKEYLSSKLEPLPASEIGAKKKKDGKAKGKAKARASTS